MLDRVTVSVLQLRLEAIVREMGEAMLRTAYSQILNSSRDFSTAICDSEGRLARRCPGLRVLLELLQPALRFFERQEVFLGVDGADELVARCVELGAAHVESRGEERHLILRRLGRGIGLHLQDFLLRLGDFRPRLFERVLMIGRIEFDDGVAGLDGDAGGNQLDDAQHAARRGQLQDRLRKFFARYADPRYDLWRGGRSKAHLISEVFK